MNVSNEREYHGYHLSKNRKNSPRSDWKLIIIVVLLVLLLMSILVAFGSILISNTAEKAEICQSKECVRSAAYFISSMNTSVDPCDDFYEYSCGMWAHNQINPNDEKYLSAFSIEKERFRQKIEKILKKNNSADEPFPIHQARDMYKACMDKDSLISLKMKPVLDLMKEIGFSILPSPFLGEDSIISWPDLFLISARLKKIANIQILIRFAITSDPYNNSTNELFFFIPFRNRLSKLSSDDDVEKDNIISYTKHMKDVAKLLIDSMPENEKLNKSETFISQAIDAGFSKFQDLNEKLDEVYQMEINLKLNNLDGSVDDVIYLTVDELNKLTNTSENIWKKYIETIFENTNITIDFNTDKIRVTKSGLIRLKEWIKILRKAEWKNLESFVWFSILHDFDEYTKEAFYTTYKGYEFESSKVCTSKVIEKMEVAISYAVLSEDNKNTTVSKAVKVFRDIKKSFEDLIADSDWMDSISKALTIEKIHNMKGFIGYPDWILKPGSVEKYYEDLVVQPNTYIQNEINYRGFMYRKWLNKFREPDVYEWKDSLTNFDGHYDREINAITLPYLLLQHPFYDLGLETLNYGALGKLFGQGMSHEIDNTNRFYDKDGNLNEEWWSNATVDQYKKRTECLRNQFSEYYLTEMDRYDDGKSTLEENFVDNVGLRAAVLAYQSIKNEERLPGISHINNEQLFFLSYAIYRCGSKQIWEYDLRNGHTPSRLRVNVGLQNTPEFAKAWNCPLGSKMNPSRDRCNIF